MEFLPFENGDGPKNSRIRVTIDAHIRSKVFWTKIWSDYFKVKEQFFHCKEAAVLCNGLCGNHDADHAIFQSLSRDKAIDKTIEHAHEIRGGPFYKNFSL